MPIIKPLKNLPPLKRSELNHEFADYVWYKNLFKDDEVEAIRAMWDEEKVIDAKVNESGKQSEKENLRKSKIIFLPPGPDTDWIYDRLALACKQANANRYKFDIAGYQTELQLAKYSEGHFFDWHMDFGAGDVSNRKLSITVQLCDENEYEGGDLQFMINQDPFTATKSKGTAIIFPSFGLHRVTPVTKGTRMSIVGWIAGPHYR
ncbi:MAG: 2OG-Fe(II) oxygenase [Bacteroidetes bacterium]|nr:2OG-Fe(II) oxygenase [Bacteroidota bacterium]